MFDFTRAKKEIDESMMEARARLNEQERLLSVAEKFSFGDEIQVRKIKLEELIGDLSETKKKMQELTNKEKFMQLWNLSSLSPREFTLRVLVHEQAILNDARFVDILAEASRIDARTAAIIVDNFMDKYTVDTGIRWILPYL